MDHRPSQRKGFFEFFGIPRTDFEHENRFVSSPFLSPLVLGVIRLVIAVYMTACCITGPVLQLQSRRTRRHAYRFPAYFTNITFMALTCYFWISGIYSLIYALTGRSPLRRYPRFLQFLHSIFYSTITTYPFIVTAVYWALISSPPHTKALGTIAARWSNISFHCLNAVFAFFEVVFSAVLPQRWTHSFFILLFLGLYISMAYIIHATSKFYVYEFMDTKSMGALTGAYIAGIGGLGIVTFLVVQGIVWFKQWCCGRRVWKSKYDIPRWPLEQRMSECSTQLEKGYGIQAQRSW